MLPIMKRYIEILLKFCLKKQCQVLVGKFVLVEFVQVLSNEYNCCNGPNEFCKIWGQTSFDFVQTSFHLGINESLC